MRRILWHPEDTVESPSKMKICVNAISEMVQDNIFLTSAKCHRVLVQLTNEEDVNRAANMTKVL